MQIKLEPGKFYKAKNGIVWCCFRVDLSKKEDAQADCVCTYPGSSRVEYFYLDGRYNGGGNREHCLIEEVPAGTKSN